MTSPKEQGKIYLEKFRTWVASASDDDFRQIVYAPLGILNRQMVKKLSGVSDNAIKKNENIKAELKKLEDELREREVLPPLTDSGKESLTAPKLDDASVNKDAVNRGQLGKLEAENLDLKVQLEQAREENARLKAKLASGQETVDAINEGLMVFLKCPS